MYRHYVNQHGKNDEPGGHQSDSSSEEDTEEDTAKSQSNSGSSDLIDEDEDLDGKI